MSYHWERAIMDMESVFHGAIGVIGVIIISGFLLGKWPKTVGVIGCLGWLYLVYAKGNYLLLVPAFFFGGCALTAFQEKEEAGSREQER